MHTNTQASLQSAAEIRKHMAEAVSYIRTKTKIVPEIAIILGTGIGGLVREVKNKVVIPYGDIPHFPVSTVESHHGKLILGTMGGKKVVVMQGRFHIYEGYTPQQVVFPIRVMAHKGGLGAKRLFLSNAAGGTNPQFRNGDLMMISDHINLLARNPLIGENDDTLGPRFPDMFEPYSRRLQALAETAAAELKIPIRRGVFASVPGPNLETRAEYRFLHCIGADAVGMSTVPENIAAVHMGMEVFAMSIITDMGYPDISGPVSLEEVIKIASTAEPKLSKIFLELVRRS